MLTNRCVEMFLVQRLVAPEGTDNQYSFPDLSTEDFPRTMHLVYKDKRSAELHSPGSSL